MSSENTEQRRIWLALGSALCRLFRINTGRGWVSRLGPKGVKKLSDGSVLIAQARSIALGLSYPNGDPVKGVCDLPGWTTITITPEMVGKQVAVFTSIEIKRTTGGRLTTDQKNWQEQVIKSGGIAGVCNCVDSAVALINDYKTRMKQKILL